MTKASYLEDFRKLNHERLHLIWKTAQTGDLDLLSDEERGLARLMLEHEDFHNQFEMADLLHDHKYDVDSEVNPFVHIVFHQIIENQLEAKDPIEVFQFFNAMRANKVSRHETIHSAALVFSYLLHDVLKNNVEFDMEKYKSLLKRLKNKKPEKIMSALEREFHS